MCYPAKGQKPLFPARARDPYVVQLRNTVEWVVLTKPRRAPVLMLTSQDRAWHQLHIANHFSCLVTHITDAMVWDGTAMILRIVIQHTSAEQLPDSLNRQQWVFFLFSVTLSTILPFCNWPLSVHTCVIFKFSFQSLSTLWFIRVLVVILWKILLQFVKVSNYFGNLFR